MKDRRIGQTQPFEYSLRINGHIIFSRSFNIPNFNPDVLDSIELKELLESIGGIDLDDVGTYGRIPALLKSRSCDYLQYYEDRPHLKEKNKDYEVKDIWAKDDNFSFEIKVEGKIVGNIRFNANTFPPRIRYNVNLKYKTNIWGDKVLDENDKPIKLRILKDIERDIRNSFSQREYTVEHFDYDLDCLTTQEEKYNELYSTFLK